MSTSPNTSWPRSDRIPQPWQNAAPVMPIVEAVNHFGRWRGVGPELFVPRGFATEPAPSPDPSPAEPVDP